MFPVRSPRITRLTPVVQALTHVPRRVEVPVQLPSQFLWPTLPTVNTTDIQLGPRVSIRLLRKVRLFLVALFPMLVTHTLIPLRGHPVVQQ